MCSGCSGDYCSDFGAQQGDSADFRNEDLRGMDEKSDRAQSHSGNRAEESQGVSEVMGEKAAPPSFSERGTCEDYEIFVSESQITEIRIVWADAHARACGENVGAA
jgi:hypothetical protein